MTEFSPAADRMGGLKVKSSLSPAGLAVYLARQLNVAYPDDNPVEVDDIMPAVPNALARLEHCFCEIDNKYFFDGASVVFNHLHGDQYAAWLYFISNEIFLQGGDTSVCSKIFLLNKACYGCDIYFEVALPSIFLLVHPLGSVLGRGSYGDYFVCYQSCGIGSNKDIYPVLGRHVTLRPGSLVLGSSVVGDFCQLGAGTLALDMALETGTTLLGRPGSYRRLANPRPYPLWRRFKQEP